MLLAIHTPELNINGKLHFGPIFPLKYDIMGPFALVPFMECRHSVWSMRHTVSGNVCVNGESYIPPCIASLPGRPYPPYGIYGMEIEVHPQAGGYVTGAAGGKAVTPFLRFTSKSMRFLMSSILTLKSFWSVGMVLDTRRTRIFSPSKGIGTSISYEKDGKQTEAFSVPDAESSGLKCFHPMKSR